MRARESTALTSSEGLAPQLLFVVLGRRPLSLN